MSPLKATVSSGVSGLVFGFTLYEAALGHWGWASLGAGLWWADIVLRWMQAKEAEWRARR